MLHVEKWYIVIWAQRGVGLKQRSDGNPAAPGKKEVYGGGKSNCDKFNNIFLSFLQGGT